MRDKYPMIDKFSKYPGVRVVPPDADNSRVVSDSNASCYSTMRRRQRQLWLLFTVAGIICYLGVYSKSVWKLLGNHHYSADKVTLTGSGFRKLLEDDELDSDKFVPQGMQRRLPQCIIIGVRKCGTRALLEFLNIHPQIQVADHEMHFFDDDSKYQLGLNWYRKKMPYSFSEQMTVEKTPRYFIDEKTPERIYKMNSSVRIIVLLKHPTTRVVSDYTQVYFNKLSKNQTFQRFEEIVLDPISGHVDTGYKAVRISVYHHHFERWLSWFPLEQIHIVDGDKLVTDPLTEVSLVEDFLGLEHKITEQNFYYNSTRGFFCMRNNTMERCLGATKGRRHPDIDPKVIEKLDNFYRPHNRRLFQMIHRQFPWS